MTKAAPIPLPDEDAAALAGEPDPELVDLMRERVVRRRSSAPKNPKAGPGRPKGQPKTGGKVAGRPNLMSPEFREWLAKKARPFELLADICAGREVEDGGVKRKPTLDERRKAAETLARKLVPDLSAAQVSAAVATTDADKEIATGPLHPNVEMARRLAFLLRSGMAASVNLPGSGAPTSDEVIEGESAEIENAADNPAPAGPAAGTDELHGSWLVRLAETLPDGRERWEALDVGGRLVATAFSRDALLAQLEGAPTDAEG